MKAAFLAAVSLLAFFPLTVVATVGAHVVPPTSYGNNQGSPTITTNITPGSGTVASITDGNTADGFKFASSLNRLQWIQFDFGAGTERIIDAFKVFTDASNTGTANGWRWAASNDLITWVELSDFTLGGAVNNYTEYTYTNTKSYRYYIMWQLVGTSITTTPKYSDFKFKIAQDTASAVPTNVAAYTHKFGFKDRTGFLTVTTTATLGGGTASNLVDGEAADNSTDSMFFTAGQSSKEVKFDLGSGNSSIFTEATWWQDSANSQGTWKIAGSNDDSSYTDITTGINLGGSNPTVISMTNSTAYRYYKLIQTAGTTVSGPWIRCVLFKGKLT